MREITYAQALNEALRECMKEDERVILLGEDIGKYGGIFQVTAGLLDEFGDKRVIDTPISEAAFVGASVGAALTGMRPVAEIMFIDFTTVCMDMIINQMAKMHYMFGGRGKVPMVLRTNIGAGRGAAAQHSQSFHALYVHIPGLLVAAPSTPYDAKGLLTEAIKNENPVIFVEHKKLYVEKGPVPEESYSIPFGKADIKREGKDLTIVATHALVLRSLRAAEEVAKEGIDVEIIDPRTLTPLDKDTILKSVEKTGRLLVADEGHKTCGVAAEISAIVAEEGIYSLRAPVQRVCSPDTPVPFSPPLEQSYIPDEKNLIPAIRRLMEYT
ncbi:MAG: alpha-ketoacid dehydrogenase subunit beta [Deltaproteobacteria bacterium]|nr:alpha-ketoacid dehydrogenase subunit beta [Deltaproteobacteria bacterium]MBW1979327.1 alpha-ketoacid dehydrogenase subunit beta [Deltaproteobacteria bacterium]MBW2298904.1 alpha-ketoacid dehydrogenase subunit beta [Deltaproteobacteria bacterium]RLB31514.1 MAG: alpha-ketoacid dehydrogenase subunit beta [Deltaproteobacteria bacterium]